jgi:hypothetical protein
MELDQGHRMESFTDITFLGPVPSSLQCPLRCRRIVESARTITDPEMVLYGRPLLPVSVPHLNEKFEKFYRFIGYQKFFVSL